MQIVGSAKLFPAMAFCSANTPAWWDLSLGYLNCWREKEKKRVLPSQPHAGFSLRVNSWDLTVISAITFWCFCKNQEGGLCIDQYHRNSEKPNTFIKEKICAFFLKTQYHTDDWSSWLNHCWKMKIFCISATVPTGGWNSGHLPNHQEFLHDWQATVSHCTLQL